VVRIKRSQLCCSLGRDLLGIRKTADSIPYVQEERGERMNYADSRCTTIVLECKKERTVESCKSV
jgi:hypothetical protein